MSKAKVKPIPDGYHTITPYISLSDAEKAIEFYKKAFNAIEIERAEAPNGKIMHAVIKIGDSLLMLSDEMPGSECGISSPKALKGVSAMIHLYVPDVDKFFNQAVKAGAKAVMPVADMFWGDRYGHLQDPFGHMWSVATHTVDMSKKEMAEAAEEFFASHKGSCCQ